MTRMLIKLDDAQLGCLTADRARAIAGTADSPLITAEAARNLAVLARKAGWHSQAMPSPCPRPTGQSCAGADPLHVATA
ncbi:hypothetical protein [Actinomadura sp. DC4]|uniref:hypothetical protein n=1 Tax=Actinomadura sp. DC4 TaxID=3055069 RepID=UPI0025B24B15|nr:hypothetical protein [Actinomadura sp. DC4]MDN3354477.1 hypothetical protein [Actinomadura sp. DC4]